jgi:glycosyltransferase involved in cell wall biosynthesis
VVIAINARVLNERRGGPARYTLNLLRELSKIDKKNKYLVFLKEPLDFGFKFPGNFTLIQVNTRSRFLFDYIYLPFFSFRNHIDYFIFPKNTFSPFIKAKTIPVYHDIIYYEKMSQREFDFWDHLHHTIMIRINAKISHTDLTVSEFTASRMQRLLGIPREKILIAKEGVEDSFRVIKDAKILKKVLLKYNIKKPFLFYAGSLSPRKNMLNVLRAFMLIKDRIPHRVYFTGGDSWRDSEIYDYIEKNHLEEYVIKIGYVEDADLVALYNLADCYLYPSVYEGFGLPILEAQACGCPVITSNRSSCPEVAGDAALIVDPESPVDIAGRILEIIKTPSLRKSLVKKGFLNVKKYSWERMARQILTLFKDEE